MEYVVLISRTVMLYVVISVIFRLMGKREIGELSILDLVVFIMIAELGAVAVENSEMPFFDAVLPMFVLVILQITLAIISLRSRRLRTLLDGKPVILIDKGKIDEKEMKKQRYNFDDLMLQLREKDIGDLRDVEYAILEPSGKLSVFPKSSKPSAFVMPLIIDGVIQEEQLLKMNKTNLWLRQHLRELGYKEAKNISYCSYRDGKFFVDLK